MLAGDGGQTSTLPAIETGPHRDRTMQAQREIHEFATEQPPARRNGRYTGTIGTARSKSSLGFSPLVPPSLLSLDRAFFCVRLNQVHGDVTNTLIK